jgi:acetyltransferase-like isoleucine patch superfamily enzyme
MIRNKINRTLNKLFRYYWKFKFKNLSIGHKVRIDWNSNLIIGNNKCTIADNVLIQSLSRGYHAGMPFPSGLLIDVKGASIEIGSGTCIHGCYLHAQKRITIGAKCAIAAGVHIIDSNGHRLSSDDRNKVRDVPESIFIGDNVWIGLNSIILKGTSIGNNCVVSAGSVVKGTYPENSLIAGNPAKVVDSIKLESE